MNSENKLIPLANIPNKHQRSDAGTYLNLPNWCEFFIKEQFFENLSDNNTKQFPYWESIKLYWVYLYLCYKLTKSKNVNILFYLKMSLNSIRFTCEYFLKLTYDSCFCFLRNSSFKSNKENLIDAINKEYLDFIKNSYWYEFDYLSRLIAYYKYSPRRQKKEKIKFTEIEKTIFLSLTFLFKQFFAKMIKVLKSINYTQTSKTTVIELDYFPESFEKNQEIKVIGEYRKHILIELPSYRGLKQYIQEINLDNNIYTIDGNNTIILVSCLFDNINKMSLVKLVPVIINKENNLKKIRAIYSIPVNYLPGFIKYCCKKNITVDNILDY